MSIGAFVLFKKMFYAYCLLTHDERHIFLSNWQTECLCYFLILEGWGVEEIYYPSHNNNPVKKKKWRLHNHGGIL